MDHEQNLRLVQFRAPGSLSDAIGAAAGKHLQSKSEYIRRSVVERLEADGFDPGAIAPRDAGSLYNEVNGQRGWALVIGDNIKGMGYFAAKPADEQGGTWIPVEYEDSEPFDVMKHWRLPPLDRLEAGRVVRVYQVVPKSWETA